MYKLKPKVNDYGKPVRGNYRVFESDGSSVTAIVLKKKYCII